ncbi:MAG: hypothetical protein II242_07790, partial [Peptococcaceae bacterium]|nr:hypothetical protein [Peptococcaceae bacterium]
RLLFSAAAGNQRHCHSQNQQQSNEFFHDTFSFFYICSSIFTPMAGKPALQEKGLRKKYNCWNRLGQEVSGLFGVPWLLRNLLH